jgi:hypothetical protein
VLSILKKATRSFDNPHTYFSFILLTLGSQGAVVSIVTRLRAGRSRVRIPAGARSFYLLRNIQTVSAAHPASNSIGTGTTFPGGILRSGCEAIARFHLMRRQRMSGSMPLLPLYVLMAWTATGLPFTFAINLSTYLSSIRFSPWGILLAQILSNA